MKKTFLIFFTFLVPVIIVAQTYEKQVFNNKNGLLENEVYGLLKDSKGFLWVTTQRALHVYDGKNMKLFPDQVGAIYEGKDGLIYGTGKNCIVRYNQLKKIDSIKTSIEESFFVSRLNAFQRAAKYSDKEGVFYYYFRYAKDRRDSISLFLNGKPKAISFTKEMNEGFEPKFIMDNTKTAWMCFENKQTGEKKLSHFTKGNLISVSAKLNCKEDAMGIFTTRNNDVYLFCRTEIFKITGNTVVKIKIPKEVGDYFMEYENRCEDSKGNIWMPYEKGLFKISGQNTSLVIDNGKREMACDSLIENSFDENGKETLSRRWVCDARVFIYTIGIDSRDRIYTGNKIYENGKFSEVFKTDRELTIYQILTDSENNIWYATSAGLHKYNYLPVKNITVSEKIRGSILYVDKQQNLYTQLRIEGKWSNINHLLVYKNNPETNAYELYDSLSIRDEKKFDPTTELSSRFMELISLKDGLAIITEESVYFYDGANLKRQDADKLTLSQDKILDNFYKNRKIKRTAMFKDLDDFLWFYYDGNYVRTDGKNFWCFGKESGIKDSLIMTEGNYSGNYDANTNILSTTRGYYFITGTKFTFCKFSDHGLPPNNERTIMLKKGKEIYFYFDSLSNPEGKNLFYHFENNKFISYKIDNPEKIKIFGRSVLKYNNYYLFYLGDGRFAKAAINDKERKITFSNINIDARYIDDYSRLVIQNDKLFVFSAFGAMCVFPLDSITAELGEPLIIPEYSIFYLDPYVRDNYLYIVNTGGMGEHESWFLKWNTKGEYFNTTKPQLNIISLSYEKSGKTVELFNTFNDIEIPSNFNPLKINFKGICLSDGNKVRYKYFLEGLDSKWNETTDDRITYSSLSPGKYKLKIMACNNHGLWNETPIEFSFTVLPPWQRTWWAYCMYVVAGFAAIRGYLKNRTKKLEKEKQKLEATVKERTLEIAKQKELIEEKNKEMIDSITYAKRIQKSLMPTDKYISRVLGKKK